MIDSFLQGYTMCLFYKWAGGLLAAYAVLIAAVPAAAQNDFTWNAGDADYNVGSNWDLTVVPDTLLDGRAIISNGGTARVSSSTTDPAQIILGNAAGETGSLIVESGGSLTVSLTQFNNSAPGINVGFGGVGAFEVQPGGDFAAEFLSLGGQGGSTAVLGGVGAGVSTVAIGPSGTTVGQGNSLRLIGPDVDYTTQSFGLSTSGTLISEITGATHSPIVSTSAPSLEGTLRVEFNGVTPAAGDTWNIFDAPSIDFLNATLDLSAAPALPAGQAYTFNAVPDVTSQNGVFGQLAVQQQLVLNVNRDTGIVSIVGGPTAVNLDGYLIQSGLGGLNASNWSSLESQGASDWFESPSGGSSNALAELQSTGTTSVTGGAPVVLGSVFQLPTPTQLGTELEDLTFEYYTPEGTVQAQVVYEGDKQFNNLVLVVDPVDGDVIIENQSALTVEIDGYTIHSDAGSLLPGDADWLSLEDQETSSWRESGETTNDLSELQPTGTTQLAGGAVLNLGSPFMTTSEGGVEDLVFQYLLPGDSEFTDGVVVYRNVEFDDLAGDYNGDGVVSASDYAVWRSTVGDNVMNGEAADGSGNGIIDSADYDVWATNFGEPSPAVAAASTTAVPEPCGVLLIFTAMGAGIVSRSR